MAGLLLLVLMVGYVALTIWLLVKVKPLWGKAIVLLVAILSPTGDDIYYRRQLDAYCKSEAGYKIYEHASRKAGLLHGHQVRTGAPLPDYLNLVPIGFVEFYDDALKKPYRHVRQSDGSIKTIEVESLVSPYEFIDEGKRSGGFLETEMTVVHRSSGKPLGIFKNMNYYGGWYRRNLLGSLADSGPTLVSNCGISEASGRYELIKQIFTQD